MTASQCWLSFVVAVTGRLSPAVTPVTLPLPYLSRQLAGEEEGSDGEAREEDYHGSTTTRLSVTPPRSIPAVWTAAKEGPTVSHTWFLEAYGR